MNLKNLTDQELLTRTDSLVQKEREILTHALHHLREVEVRRLFSDLGYKSLFEFAVKRLGYSGDQAARRIAAMRLIKEMPEIEERIEAGALNLTTLGMAQTYFRQEKLSRDEKMEFITTLEHKSKREAEKIIVEASSSPVTFQPDRMRSLGGDAVEMKFQADDKLAQKLAQVKGLLAHAKGDMNMAQLLDTLCDIAIEQLSPAAQKSPAPGLLRRETKTVSELKRRHLWQRAQGKCENCGSRHRLEADHIQPRALGGSNDIDNLRLLCRPCNQRAAVRVFGHEAMREFVES